MTQKYESEICYDHKFSYTRGNASINIIHSLEISIKYRVVNFYMSSEVSFVNHLYAF
jgi:hypothetical protein